MGRTSTDRFVHTVSPDEDGMRLDMVVGAWLEREMARALARPLVRKLIMAGVIRVGRRPIRRPASTVHTGARLDAFIDAERLAGTRRRDTPAADLAVLYEDDDLIAVAKPAGVVMHATADPHRADLFNTVRRLFALPYLGLHHRLDVETSGVVLFTKQQRANAGLADQFSHGEVTKVYHAIVGRPRGRVRRHWRVENRLAMSGTGRSARMQQAAGGAPARTDFAILETLPAGLLVVEARPHTGRKHQVRAHLAGGRMPILGDLRYGGAARVGSCAAARVMLHAFQLALKHPVTGAALTITCPYPPDFAACLERLRGR